MDSRIQKNQSSLEDWPGITVKPNQGGKGVFALQTFEPGETILVFKACFVPQPSRDTIQMDATRHLDTAGNPGAFFNHSCEPNARFDAQSLAFIALRHISSGDELCFNYCTTEWELDAPFSCTCGSKQCKNRILGFGHLSRREQLELQSQLTPYLQKRLSQRD